MHAEHRDCRRTPITLLALRDGVSLAAVDDALIQLMRPPRTHQASNASNAASRLESDAFGARPEAETAGGCCCATGDELQGQKDTKQLKGPFGYHGFGSYL